MFFYSFPMLKRRCVSVLFSEKLMRFSCQAVNLYALCIRPSILIIHHQQTWMGLWNGIQLSYVILIWEYASPEPNRIQLKSFQLFPKGSQREQNLLELVLNFGLFPTMLQKFEKSPSRLFFGLCMVSNFFGLEFPLVYVIPPGVTAKLYG